jgi:S1-C subfamily serine protease
MVSCTAALLACALVTSGETALYEFKADWCEPCQQMAGTVQELTDAGFPVRQIDVEQDAATRDRFGVGPLPCFVLVVDGQEVDRVVGAVSRAELEGMFTRAGVRNVEPAFTEVAKTSPPPRQLPATAPAQMAPAATAAPDLIAVSARLRIEDATGQSYGSGTVIDSRNGEALIITCGHVFRDSQGKGKITVDLFGAGGAQGLPGQLVGFDLERDLGFVAIRTGTAVPSAPVAARAHASQVGEAVCSVGCNGGEDPTVMSSRVTAIDKYLGPPNIQASGMPVQGRSGGGLFNAQGELIGVCNAADPQDQEGLYAAIGAIHEQMDELKLSSLIATAAPQTVAVTPAADVRPVSHEAPAGFSQEAEVMSAVSEHQGAEVICIVRSLHDPRAKSDVIVLDRASPEFLARLTSERSVQENRRLTSHQPTKSDPKRKQSSAWRPANPRTTRKLSLSTETTLR